jgi:hypothetical protein
MPNQKRRSPIRPPSWFPTVRRCSSLTLPGQLPPWQRRTNVWRRISNRRWMLSAGLAAGPATRRAPPASRHSPGDYRVNFREGGSGSTHSSGWQRLSVAERWYGLKLHDPRTSEPQISRRTGQAPRAWEGGPAASACQRSLVSVATVAQSLPVRTNPSFQTKP